ncbi:MAG: hypothetical protein K5790_02635 [Nitrosopumilus sp.]|uniref:hypothetical protein n=1 Tax=Nitrosopumilus sp. TaxID=2024843 RepID=UPI00247C547F|nr:hypothetical protein [Nitrosopumilus sp.]MCV0392173.1 hypothetical protein [Nitrosopumilus sp.]
MKQYSILIGIGIAAIGIMAAIFGSDILKLSISTQEYDIFVDPILDKQNLFVMGRVTIQNTGSQPLTNVRVNFGSGDTLDLGTIKAGQKIIVSPPPENPMEYVMISADNDIFVNKAYREMPKMVGMMGS